MLLETLALVLVAILLAGPVPRSLAAARWPRRSPRAALVLWQAVGLGGGLSLLSIGLTIAAFDVDRSWVTGVHAALTDPSRLSALGWAGLSLTAAVAGWLIAVSVASSARIVLARREHRRRLDLVAEPATAGAGRSRTDLLVLDHPVAAAYCVPGIRPRIVVSQPVLQMLAPEELAAVVAHERAHAYGRHDLVVQPFIAWRNTFPFLPDAHRALAAVQLLTEMLADDTARDRSGSAPLAAALQAFTREGVLGVAEQDQFRVRSTRLADCVPAARSVTTLVYLLALVVVVVPPVLLAAA